MYTRCTRVRKRVRISRGVSCSVVLSVHSQHAACTQLWHRTLESRSHILGLGLASGELRFIDFVSLFFTPFLLAVYTITHGHLLEH